MSNLSNNNQSHFSKAKNLYLKNDFSIYGKKEKKNIRFFEIHYSDIAKQKENLTVEYEAAKNLYLKNDFSIYGLLFETNEFK